MATADHAGSIRDGQARAGTCEQRQAGQRALRGGQAERDARDGAERRDGDVLADRGGPDDASGYADDAQPSEVARPRDRRCGNAHHQHEGREHE